jgi:hypothetical protein
MTREKLLDTGIFWVANALAVALTPIEMALGAVLAKVDDLGYASNEVIGGYKWKYRVVDEGCSHKHCEWIKDEERYDCER